jgi:hypothetical protein
MSNNTVTIGYQNMQTCNLTVNGVVVSQISGTGSVGYAFTQAGTSAAVACGNVTQNVSVLTYQPKFTQAQFNTTSGTSVNLVFTTNGLNQTISVGGQTFTTLNNFVSVNLAAGTYVVTLSTVGTNPILSTTTQLVVIAAPVPPQPTPIPTPTPVPVPTPTPAPGTTYISGVYPTPTTTLIAGSSVTVQWTSNQSVSDSTTVLLYSGTVASSVYLM